MKTTRAGNGQRSIEVDDRAKAIAYAAASIVTEDTTIEVPAALSQRVIVHLESETPLVMHAWGHKAREQLRRQGLDEKKKREPRNPEKSRLDCYHMISGKPETPDAVYGVPCEALMSAMVSAAKDFKKLGESYLRRAVRILPSGRDQFDMECLRLVRFSKPRGREDVMRVGPWSNRQPDLRYRPEFKTWGLDVMVKFDPEIIGFPSILNLIARAGDKVGLLEGRREKSSECCGSFRVMGSKIVEEEKPA